MPFVNSDDWERLQQDNINMAGELARYRAISGVMGLAVILQQEIADRLEDPTMSPSQIGDEAYLAVLSSSLGEARKQLVTEYEEAHRTELYKRAVDEVRALEGDNLLCQAREKIETNPELMVELRESARKELSARAIDIIKGEITAEQQDFIDKEAERQLALDRLDVEFAVEGELDLFRDDINELLHPGDMLILTYKGSYGQQKRLVLVWTKDAKEQLGWGFESSQEEILYTAGGYTRTIGPDKFLYVGSVQNDMVKGRPVDTQNVLKRGCEVLFEVDGEKGKYTKLDAFIRNRDNYTNSRKPVVLEAIDFRTRSIVFNS